MKTVIKMLLISLLILCFSLTSAFAIECEYGIKEVNIVEKNNVITYEYVCTVPPVEGGGDETNGETNGDLKVNECADPKSSWIFCDDFDDPVNDNLVRSNPQRWQGGSGGALIDNEGIDGSKAYGITWTRGEVPGGGLNLVFGDSPVNLYTGHTPHRAGEKFNEVFVRFYVKQSSNFEGYPAKFIRLRVNYAAASWNVDGMPMAEWHLNGRSDTNQLLLVSYSNTRSGGNTPVSSAWNDYTTMCNTTAQRSYANLSNCVGNVRCGCGVSINANGFAVQDTKNEYHCIELQLKLNDPVSTSNTQGNGVFRVWIDGKVYHEVVNQNSVENYTDRGINALNIEGWWNTGSPNVNPQTRYFDNFVIGTERIGCGKLK